MTLLAAFQSLLYRYTGQDDITVGTPIAARTHIETEGLIGCFLNTLVLRTDLSRLPTCRQLFARVRQVTLEAYAHQELPFEKLVEQLQPERELNRSPLFQVMFNLENLRHSAPKSGQGSTNSSECLSINEFEFDWSAAQFDLTLEIVTKDQELSCLFVYNRDLFEGPTIKRMAGHFQTLLEGIVANPSQPISDLPILTEAERHQLLVEWNECVASRPTVRGTATDYPKELCIHQLFEAQVARTPDAIAVVFKNQPLTYRELNQRANQLAHYLIAQGVEPEVVVALCMERSIEMVVGLLGILKAGGTYLPLDPTYPKERLAFMLADSDVSVLLTQSHLQNRLPTARAATVIELNHDDSKAAFAANPSIDVTAQNLAYIMWTSGSTGRPKGVQISHRSVVRLVKSTNYVSLTPDEVLLQLAPLSFDASTFEIWGAQLNGAQLVVMPPTTPSLAELAAAIKRYRVSTLWLTAGLFHLMVDEQLEALKGVPQLLAGGDVLSVPHVQKLLSDYSGTLINGYGPTENTTFTCCYRMNKTTQLGLSVPIGRPIANTQVYILDDHHNPVPIGVPGTLYIGGDGLARGYLNQPELSEERFIQCSFPGVPNPELTASRLYNSGDQARYLPDGNIEFLGRKDNQVKIRGFRIELGEIEVVLSRHPAVREAVVVATPSFGKEGGGHKRLVAYIVADNELTATQLRRFLSEKLPAYMLPATYVQLDALPLTPNGKIDRRALPAPDMSRATLEEPFVAPRTPIERQLADIWGELLQIEQVGIHDNFFSLGGHSLKEKKLS